MGSVSSLPSDVESVQFLELIGEGSFGNVYKAEWEGRSVAAKQLLKHHFRYDDTTSSFYRECQTLRGLKHKNIVRMFKVIDQGGVIPPILILELLHCDLRTYIDRNAKPTEPIPLKKVVSITLDVAEGLHYLQKRRYPIAHRDLASKNILLTKNEQAKIADLGLARVLVSDTEASPIPGTLLYAAPETFPSKTAPCGVYLKPNYDVRVDVFSFGVLLLEVITGSLPRPDPRDRIVDHEENLIPEHQRRRKDISKIGRDHSLSDLVLQCLENDREARPTTQKIIEKLSEEKEKIDQKIKIGSSRCAKLKVLTLGASGVGKTCILERLVNSDFVSENALATVGTARYTLNVTHNGIAFTLEMHDTAGQERYRGSIPPLLFRGLDAVIFVFDVTDCSSLFKEIPYFLQLLASHSRYEFLSAILVGNKADQARKVTGERAKIFAREYGMPYIETSAKTGQNIERLFEQLVQMVYDRLDLSDIETYFPSEAPSETQGTNSGCCT